MWPQKNGDMWKQINREPLQVLASCLAAASLAQFVEPEKAKILKEQRFNAGDGRWDLKPCIVRFLTNYW